MNQTKTAAGILATTARDGGVAEAPDATQFIDVWGDTEEEYFVKEIPVSRRASGKGGLRLKTVVRNRNQAEKPVESESYFRRLRKQHFSTIQLVIRRIGNLDSKANIQSYTAEVLDEVDFALGNLTHSAAARRFEGNAAEMLRLLRDSLMDDGWNRYRDSRVTKHVVEILEANAFSDTVEPSNVAKMRDQMAELGLQTCSALNELKKAIALEDLQQD